MADQVGGQLLGCHSFTKKTSSKSAENTVMKHKRQRQHHRWYHTESGSIVTLYRRTMNSVLKAENVLTKLF